MKKTFRIVAIMTLTTTAFSASVAVSLTVQPALAANVCSSKSGACAGVFSADNKASTTKNAAAVSLPPSSNAGLSNSNFASASRCGISHPGVNLTGKTTCAP